MTRDAPEASADGAGARGRRARVATTHDAPAVVARAVAPDNTDDIATRVDGDRVVTTLRRDGTGGLAATLDDYVVNASVADRVAAVARGDATEGERTDEADATEGERTDDAPPGRAAQPDDRPTTDTNDT